MKGATGVRRCRTNTNKIKSPAFSLASIPNRRHANMWCINRQIELMHTSASPAILNGADHKKVGTAHDQSVKWTSTLQDRCVILCPREAAALRGISRYENTASKKCKQTMITVSKDVALLYVTDYLFVEIDDLWVAFSPRNHRLYPRRLLICHGSCVRT